MNIISIGLSIATHLLNRYIRQDQTALTELTKHQGKTIKVMVTDSKLVIFLLIETNKITLTNRYQGDVAVTIAGSANALLKSISSTKTHAATITISGDTELLHTVKKVFANLDIDWEEQLSKYTGDVIAHQIGNQFRSLKKLCAKSKQSIESNVVEYLQEESRTLVTQAELTEFHDNVTTCRHDVERLQVRIKNLAVKKSP